MPCVRIISSRDVINKIKPAGDTFEGPFSASNSNGMLTTTKDLGAQGRSIYSAAFIFSLEMICGPKRS